MLWSLKKVFFYTFQSMKNQCLYCKLYLNQPNFYRVVCAWREAKDVKRGSIKEKKCKRKMSFFFAFADFSPQWIFILSLFLLLHLLASSRLSWGKLLNRKSIKLNKKGTVWWKNGRRIRKFRLCMCMQIFRYILVLFMSCVHIEFK